MKSLSSEVHKQVQKRGTDRSLLQGGLFIPPTKANCTYVQKTDGGLRTQSSLLEEGPRIPSPPPAQQEKRKRKDGKVIVNIKELFIHQPNNSAQSF